MSDTKHDPRCAYIHGGSCDHECAAPTYVTVTLPERMTVPDVAMIVDEDIELHTWPPERRGGQHVGRYEFGVLAIHKPTGIAFASTFHRSQMQNRLHAIEKLKTLVNINAQVRERALQADYKP